MEVEVTKTTYNVVRTIATQYLAIFQTKYEQPIPHYMFSYDFALLNCSRASRWKDILVF